MGTWTEQGTAVSAAIMTMECDALVQTVAEAMTITHNMPCTTLLNELYNAMLMGLKISNYITNQTSCPASLAVSIPGALSPAANISAADSVEVSTTIADNVLSGSISIAPGVLIAFSIGFACMWGA